MAFEATTILQLVLFLTWQCLSSTPANLQHTLFLQVITSDIVLKEIASAKSLAFAPGLLEVLQATNRPLLPTSRPYLRILSSDGLSTSSCWRNQALGPKSTLARELIACTVFPRCSRTITDMPLWLNMLRRLWTMAIPSHTKDSYAGCQSRLLHCDPRSVSCSLLSRLPCPMHSRP